jgi:alpha-tubulin suppressor-like RCC1 family protein
MRKHVKLIALIMILGALRERPCRVRFKKPSGLPNSNFSLSDDNSDDAFDSEPINSSNNADGVILGNNSDAAKEVGCGDAIGYVVTEDGRLLVWGKYVTRYLVENGDRYSGTRVPTQIATGVLTASGYYGTLAYVDTNNDLWIWGDNEKGLIGDGTTAGSATPVFVMHNIESIKLGWKHVIALDSDGGVWAWGNNNGEAATRGLSCPA